MGRCGVGVGEGITGFSLSLPRSGTSVLLCCRWFVPDGSLLLTLVALAPTAVLLSWGRTLRVAFRSSRDASCRCTVGASAPRDDLGFVDRVVASSAPVSHGWADRTRDVDHPATGSADVMVP